MVPQCSRHSNAAVRPRSCEWASGFPIELPESVRISLTVRKAHDVATASETVSGCNSERGPARKSAVSFEDYEATGGEALWCLKGMGEM
jgi:hypothetical protein